MNNTRGAAYIALAIILALVVIASLAAWADRGRAASAMPTNLSVVYTPTEVDVRSSTGDDARIGCADDSRAGALCEADYTRFNTAAHDHNNETPLHFDTGQGGTISGAGTSASPYGVANPFTDADETKLAGIAAGAEVNVQSDWDETSSTSDAFILNKPTSAWRGAWAASTQYRIGDRVSRGGAIYTARVDNNETSFTASHWFVLPELAAGQGIGLTVNGKDVRVAIENGGVSTAKLADGAVTSAKLGSGAVHESNLNGDSVSTAKIKDGAVTAPKLAGGVLPTPRGAGTGLALNGNNLDFVLDTLNPAFSHRLVRTFALTVDGTNDNFEAAISNDNQPSAWTGEISGNTDDILLVEKDSATDAHVLDGVEDGDWIFISIGSSRLLFKIAAVRDSPSDSGVRQILFDGDASYRKGLNQYLQPTAYGAGIIAFSSMGNPAFLRLALPTGSTPAVTQDTNLLLADWGEASVAALAEEVLPEPEYVTQTGWQWRGEYDADNPPVISSNNEIGETNLGQLWLQPPASKLADIDRYGRRDHVFVVWKDADNYIEYRLLSNLSTQSNRRYLAFNTSGNNVNKVKVGTLGIDDAVSLRLYSAFVTNDRVAQTIGSAPNQIEIPSAKAVADYVADPAKSGETENVAGAGGTAGQVWTRGSSATNAAWADAGGGELKVHKQTIAGSSIKTNYTVTPLIAAADIGANEYIAVQDVKLYVLTPFNGTTGYCYIGGPTQGDSTARTSSLYGGLNATGIYTLPPVSATINTNGLGLGFACVGKGSVTGGSDNNVLTVWYTIGETN